MPFRISVEQTLILLEVLRIIKKHPVVSFLPLCICMFLLHTRVSRVLVFYTADRGLVSPGSIVKLAPSS